MEVCGTPIRWIREALDIHDEMSCEQRRVMSNIFPESGTKSCHQYDIYLMDVILNQSIEPAIRGATVDPNIAVPMRAFQPGNQVANMDFKYQTMIAFLEQAALTAPGSGVVGIVELISHLSRTTCCGSACNVTIILMDHHSIRLRKVVLSAGFTTSQMGAILMITGSQSGGCCRFI